MQLREAFYCRKNTSQTNYSWEQVGPPDIMRLAQNKSYWISPLPLTTDAPKKLILADWTAKFWSPEKLYRVTSMIEELLDKGITFYVWHQKEVKLLDKQLLLELNKKFFRTRISLDSHENITQSAIKKHKISRDEIAVVDDYWLEQLLDQHASKLRVLRTSELVGMTTEEATQLFNILKSATPPLEKIIHDEFSQEAHQIAQVLKTTFKHIPFTCDFKSALLSYIELEPFEMQRENGENPQCYTSGGYKLYTSQIEHLSQLTVHYQNGENEFNPKDKTLLLSDITRDIRENEYLLQRKDWSNLPDLVTLRVLEDDLNEITNIYLPKLASLDIEFMATSAENLQILLCGTPNIVALSLQAASIRHGMLQLEEESLFNLSTLNLIDCKISDDNLKIILKASPNIKTIYLSDMSQLRRLIQLLNNEPIPPYLEFINFQDKSRELKKEAIPILEESLKLIPQLKTNIKKLDISNADISPQQFKKILYACPEVEMIQVCDAFHSEETDHALVLDSNFLFKLKEIQIKKSKKSTYTILQTLLNAAPHFEVLKLSSNENVDELLLGHPLNLSRIQYIVLSDAKLSSQCLEALFKNAMHLTKLNINGCEINGKLTLSRQSLSTLQTLRASMSTVENLNTIFQAIPNIVEIYLNKTDYTEFLFQLLDNQFPKLEAINLKDTKISSQNLQLLLKAAPSVKKIYLTSCIDQPESLQLKAGSLPHLTAIHLSSDSTLSPGNLAMLQKAAPNAVIIIGKNEVQSTLDAEQGMPPLLHNPNKYKKHQPTIKPFEYTGKQRTKNQGMIIEQFSQYLTLIHPHASIIPKIQDGICLALSYYFLDNGMNDWDTFIQQAQTWNGELATLSPPLKAHFDTLNEYIQHCQFNQTCSQQYLGDNISQLLSKTSACILSNPWHAIAVKYIEEDTWQVYDANHSNGYQTVSEKDLQQTIRQSIGDIVSVDMDEAVVPSHIQSPNHFIEQGGLLMLCECNNMASMLKDLPATYQYTKEALDGILLRDTLGKPAWLIGIQHRNTAIQAYTQSLLNQFKASDKTAEEQLAKSLNALTTMQQHECITTLIQQNKSQDKPNTLLVDIIRKSSQKSLYEKTLTTWDDTTEAPTSTLAYLQDCIQPNVKKRLIKLSSSQALDTLQLELQQLASSISRPVFYVDKPEDLICSAAYIKKNQDNSGILCKGPGGPLFDFLQENQSNNPLLIVNYERFNAEDLVRFNGLLDKVPHADGTLLPPNMQLIGLMNTKKPDYYQGSDFYSRFNHVEACPLSSAQWNSLKPARVIQQTTAQSKTIINLFHAADWEQRLLGYWKRDGDTLTFQEGELIRAIEANQPIEIQNGEWQNPEFVRFWQHLLNTGIRHQDKILKIPEHLSVIRPKTEAYDFALLQQSIQTFHDGISHKPHVRVLSASNISDFFQRYEVKNGKLVSQPGWIEEAAARNAPLEINVISTLSDDAWAMLLTKCAKLKLNIHKAPNVEFPNALQQVALPLSKPPQWKSPLPQNGHDLMLISTDIDTTVAILTQESSYDVIDVSECTASDLLFKLDGQLNQDTLRFRFKKSIGALNDAIKHKRNIILKGEFSTALLDALTPLLIQRENSINKSQIICVTGDPKAGACLQNRMMHSVTTSEKLNYLPYDKTIIHKLGSALHTEPLSMLQARCQYLAANPDDEESENAWSGMLSAKAVDTIENLSTEAFTKKRMDSIRDVLKNSPYVFLSGPSGVGKSTFVEKELSKENALFIGEANILKWVFDKSDKSKILFLDEANLSHSQWSQFEGLFHKPPSILVNGKLYPISDKHKVIFAGNPLNYGDERQQATLFKRHGAAVLFTPMPTSMIQEKILNPVIENPDLSHIINKRILDVYQFICQCSTTDILISPRELQMMALLTLSHAKHYPQHNINTIIEHFSYDIAKNLIPKDKKVVFDEQFKPQTSLYTTQESTTDNPSFLVTPSRTVLSHQLTDLLNLRRWRHSGAQTLNDAQKFGGLGGIVIEGEPGIGKSELVIDVLLKQKFTEIHDLKHLPSVENGFYRMPVSMPLSEKEELLIKAFQEGHVVVIDEINSSPMMEKLLNDLLMGKNPKKDKNTPPPKPGFMIIGTQNPITMSGRRAMSTALQRRLVQAELPEYQPEETKAILLNKGIPSLEADTIIDIYQEKREYARTRQLTPAPNFRNIINLVQTQLDIAKKDNPKPLPPVDKPLKPFSSGMNELINDIMNALSPDEKIHHALSFITLFDPDLVLIPEPILTNTQLRDACLKNLLPIAFPMLFTTDSLGNLSACEEIFHNVNVHFPHLIDYIANDKPAVEQTEMLMTTLEIIKPCEPNRYLIDMKLEKYETLITLMSDQNINQNISSNLPQQTGYKNSRKQMRQLTERVLLLAHKHNKLTDKIFSRQGCIYKTIHQTNTHTHKEIIQSIQSDKLKIQQNSLVELLLNRSKLTPSDHKALVKRVASKHTDEFNFFIKAANIFEKIAAPPPVNISSNITYSQKENLRLLQQESIDATRIIPPV